MLSQAYRSLHSTVAAAALLLITVSPSLAVDGVIEINQAKALAGGVTPGDAAGFPVTIDQSGSYRLTSNLILATTGDHAIQITSTSQNVTIDLNGFSITGPNSCTGGGSSISCTFNSGGHGILMDQGVDSVRVMNGAIQGMGGNGIAGSTVNLFLEGVAVSENGSSGVSCGRCQILRNRIFSNRQDGISCGAACVIVENRIEFSGLRGITATFGLHNIHRNVIVGHGSFGIDTKGAIVATENVVADNGGGIRTTPIAGGGSRIEGNTVRDNTGNGIEVGTASAVEGNSVAGNSGVGLVLGANSGYAQNVIDSNAGGTVSGGIEMGTNVCDGNTTCP